MEKNSMLSIEEQTMITGDCFVCFKTNDSTVVSISLNITLSFIFTEQRDFTVWSHAYEMKETVKIEIKNLE